MRDQASRDEKTLQIASALLVFVVVLGSGVALVAWVSEVLDLTDRVTSSFVVVAIGLAVLAAGRGLVGRGRGR